MERLVDEAVDDPLHLVSLEDEQDFVRAEIDGVPLQPASLRIEGRPLRDQLCRARFGAVLQESDDCDLFHDSSLGLSPV
jgi:hypothetical protein